VSHLESLLNLLDVQPAGQQQFTGEPSDEPHVRAFGGLLVAQALVAAGRTVDSDRQPHSLHSYFIRPANPTKPISYQVETIRDGRSFSTRRVTASQSDKTIFEMMASFHVEEAGVEHSEAVPSVTQPEQLTPFEDRFAGREATDMTRWFLRVRPFDLRYVDLSPFDFSQEGTPARQQVWIKTKVPMTADVLLHYGVFAYVSDFTVLDPILLRHGIRWTDEAILGASLDHSLWFHRSLKIDEWLLLDQESPVATGARGLATGKVWTLDGGRVATITQEALLRPPFTERPSVLANEAARDDFGGIG
jgi:acyl-CoA thioesterase II